MNITTEQEQQLEKAFEKFEVTGGPGSAGINTMGVQEDFCTNWPNARNALSFMASLSMLPSEAKTAITTVISAGDVVSNIVCR